MDMPCRHGYRQGVKDVSRNTTLQTGRCDGVLDLSRVTGINCPLNSLSPFISCSRILKDLLKFRYSQLPSPT